MSYENVPADDFASGCGRVQVHRIASLVGAAPAAGAGRVDAPVAPRRPSGAPDLGRDAGQVLFTTTIESGRPRAALA